VEKKKPAERPGARVDASPARRRKRARGLTAAGAQGTVAVLIRSRLSVPERCAKAERSIRRHRTMALTPEPDVGKAGGGMDEGRVS